MKAANPGRDPPRYTKEAQVPHSLARLPLTALATGLAAGAAITAALAAAVPPARAAEAAPPAPPLAPPLAYVLDGLDGPELVTAPGSGDVIGLDDALPADSAALPAPTSGAEVSDGPASPRPDAPVLIRLAMAAPLLPQALAPSFTSITMQPIPLAALVDLRTQVAAPAAEAPRPALPQGPMPDGSALAANPAAAEMAQAATTPAGSELPPLDPAQPAVSDTTPAPPVRTVLSRLDGPGPLPALRPVAAMVGQDATSAPADPAADLEDPAPAPAAPESAAPGDTESLTDAIIASLKGNPEIQISLAQQDDARYAVNEARANYLPRIDVSGAWGREFARTIPQAATQRFRSEATVALNQNLWDFGVTINDIKRAKASYRSAQWGTRERIEGISYDITNAYLGVLLQQKLVALAEGEIASVQKILRIVTVQKDLGLTTPADVERAQTRLDNVRSQLLDRQSALEQARSSYRRLTNHMPLRAAEVPAAGTALPESADAAVDLIDTRSPRLAQAVEDRRSLDKQYDSQADTALPRFGLTIASDYRQDVLGSTGRAVDARAMVTFSYRLYNGGGATATKRRIAARLRQADYELDRRRREVEQDIRIDYASLGAAREKIATIEAEISSAERVADLYKHQFRGGRRTVFDLLDAEQLLFAARAKQNANLIALRAAEYRVLQKLGGLFDLVSGGQPLPDLAQPAPGSDD
jgi:TolC family type I secretion outer membrane protein